MHVQHCNTVDCVQIWHMPLCQNVYSRMKQFYKHTVQFFPEYSLQVTLDCHVYKF